MSALNNKRISNSKQKWPRQEESITKELILYRCSNRLSQKYIARYSWSWKAICFTYL